tara:strand:- start:85 stop:447 length:363 start_codon:yes stop_codon:yes gene_type:complete
MALVDLKRAEADETSESAAMPIGPDGGQYPYGCCICLDKDELDKLGITKLPEIGAEFHGVFVAQVTRISQSADMGMCDESMSMSLQITMLEIKEEAAHPGEGTETAKDEAREFRTLLSGI